MAGRKELGGSLTNEKLRGIFKSNFELALHAIRMGRHYLRAGHEMTLDSLLENLRKNPHQFEEHPEED